jgi:polysaccharide pyruvyl transferase WcaK-like protein
MVIFWKKIIHAVVDESRRLIGYVVDRAVPRRIRARSGAMLVARIGLFGILGAGNLGNDGSLVALLDFLKNEHPDVALSCLCPGADLVTARYGVAAVPMTWRGAGTHRAPTRRATAAKIAGRAVSAVRTVVWVRRQDLVIVPGMGVLEASPPLRPWGFPFTLFLLCCAGRVTGTRVALVSVGAEAAREPATRWLITQAARLAAYRSYRDTLSRDAMREMGVDVSADEVYADLAFTLPSPMPPPGRTGTVGVGVMAYRGDNDERHRADEIYRTYVENVTAFVRWLVDNGYDVRLLIGDQKDEVVVGELVTALREQRPGLDPARIVADAPATLDDLQVQMAMVDSVLATRYHNVLIALKLGKPTISISYADKNNVLMAAMGLDAFCQPAGAVDLDLLIEQFQRLEASREQIVPTLVERNRIMTDRLAAQFQVLSTQVIGPHSEERRDHRPRVRQRPRTVLDERLSATRERKRSVDRG